MSDERSTERMVGRLAGDLAPVRPIAPLHRQALAVAAAWAATALAATLLFGAAHPLAVIARGPVSASFLWLLGLLAPAALVLGLASRIPGRERAAWIAAGLGAAALLGLGCVALALGGGAFATPFGECERCALRSVALALPAGLVAGLLARRGAPWRPGLAGAAIALGAAAAGGFLVHLGCPRTDASHWLQGHALAPIGVGAALGLAVGYTGRMPRFFGGSGSSGRAR